MPCLMMGFRISLERKKTTGAAVAKELGVDEQLIDIDGLDLGSSSESEEEDGGDHGDTGGGAPEPTLDAIEVFKEKTLEDIIEEQRAKLAAEGQKGTPVTEASFAKWRAEKLVKKQAEAEARLKAEQMKKKGGKGLSVLSGKELFSYNASLFVDDDAALNQEEEQALSQETRAREAEEERRAEEDRERAQREQMRLAEAQLIEEQIRRQKDEMRREAARSRKHTIVVDGVVVNQPVFDVEEYEDLTPFNDVDGMQVSIDEGLFEDDDEDVDLEELEDDEAVPAEASEDADAA